MCFPLRLCCATLSALVVVVFMPDPAYLLYRLSPYWNCFGAYCHDLWFWYNDLSLKIRALTGGLWMASWAFLEIRYRRRLTKPIPKLLTHLHYGPIAILIFSIATILASDALLIQYSRWQIVRYIHSDAPVTEPPALKLHNNYRGWCGNGYVANIYYLYSGTSAAYLSDQDPAIRARALQANVYVSSGFDDSALKKAETDSDPMVRDVAAKLAAELFQHRAP